AHRDVDPALVLVRHHLDAEALRRGAGSPEDGQPQAERPPAAPQGLTHALRSPCGHSMTTSCLPSSNVTFLPLCIAATVMHSATAAASVGPPVCVISLVSRCSIPPFE